MQRHRYIGNRRRKMPLERALPGKIWDCVVLLDEAEVFLQTRDLEDLQRNAVTTARQLAMFKKESLTKKTLEHVIKVSSKFDNYLKQVNENLSDEEIARDLQVR